MRAIVTAISTLTLTLLIGTTPSNADGLTRFESRANDMTGYQPSLYEGRWHSPKHEDFRRCIMKRESHYNYRAANRSSSARGAYQFLDNSWRIPLTHMMIREDKKHGGYLVREIRDLRDVPIHKWNRYWQDRAFWTAFRHGDGAHHWHYSGSPCNGLA
jgi:hypothetical protein